MSEIFAPGSIAGPQGTIGAAGSQGSVTALASSVMPVPGNLFNFAAAKVNFVTASDGSIVAQSGAGGGPSWITNLMYCPGATQLVLNYTAADSGFGPGAFIQLFDANGTFVSVLGSMGSWSTAPGTVITLPGTQVYARMTLLQGVGPGVPPSGAMICVGTSLPVYASFGPNVSSVEATNIAAAVSAQTTATNTSIQKAVNALATGIIPTPLNRLDPNKCQIAHVTNADGTVSASAIAGSPIATGMIYCPGATRMICNQPVFTSTNGQYLQLFDSQGIFTGTAPVVNGASYINNMLEVVPLPGTQTYIRFTMSAAASSNQGPAPTFTMVYAGDATTIPALTQYTKFVPFFGYPTPTRGSIRRASELGCALDCVLSTGLNSFGTAPTDDTALLNAFLATASATNPIKLIIDGVASITGLVVAAAGYTTIEGVGWQSGIYLASGSNVSSITLGSVGAYNVAAPARIATDITLRDFTINGNGAGQTADGYGAMLSSCTNSLIDHVQFLQAFYFAMTFSNASGIVVRGCTFTSGGTMHDGVHLNGPVEDVLISDCVFATGDDAVAINCPEGYGGDISRVVVTNCVFNNALTVARIYTSLGVTAMSTNNIHKARQIAFSNCVGSTRVCAFSLGINGPGTQSTADVNQIEDLLIENCDITSNVNGESLGWILVSDSVGLLQVRGCVMRSPTIATPFVMFNGISQVSHLVLSDVTILRNSTGNSTPALFDNTNAISVGKLTINGARVTDEAGTSYAAIAEALVFGSPVAELVIESLDMDHFTALAASFANVSVARGAGLLGTGAQIADATMGNNALYLSFNASGTPSIKVAGVAKRLAIA